MSSAAAAKTLMHFAPKAAPPPSADAASPTKTLMHFGPRAAPARSPEAPVQAPARHAFQRTMMGVAEAPIDRGSPASPASPPAPSPFALPLQPPPAPRPGEVVSQTKTLAKQTMLGVAIPGIAPLNEPGAPPPEPPPDSPPLPWMAPPPFPPGPAMSIVPAPAPLSDLPPPLPPKIVRKGGVSLVAAALLAGGLLVVGGGVIAWFWRSTPPIAAQPRSTPDGKDVLHLGCDPRSCKDGTTVEAAGARAIFTGGESDLVLSQPLHVGDNALALHIDRPGMGRDEDVKLVVPVVYRINADVSTMGSTHPSLAIRVHALPGSDVTVDGKHVALDADGTGSYAIDETAATEGPADESKILAADVPYVVVPPGLKPDAAEHGTVAARVPVAPLRVDSPRGHLVTESDHVELSGRAPKGATVTVEGAPVPSSVDGMFETSVPLPAGGERTIEVRAGTAGLSPRTVHVQVKRVTHLADEARAFEAEVAKPIGYDAAMASLGDSVGRSIVVYGEVVESRGSVMLVDDRRGCAKGPCATRVLLPEDASFAKSAIVRAYGRIVRPFRTPAGQTVPEVEADFVISAKR
jgi:hypothetical protein